jgi:hypothetical protein
MQIGKLNQICGERAQARDREKTINNNSNNHNSKRMSCFISRLFGAHAPPRASRCRLILKPFDRRRFVDGGGVQTKEQTKNEPKLLLASDKYAFH